MKRFPAKVVSLVLALAMSLSLLTVSTVAEENGWWTEEIWDAETLISLGAKPPLFNKKTGYYEIETPEQLLYLSGNWKSTDTNGDGQPDAPRNGHYVLTADLDMGPLMKKIGKTITEASGKETDGYMLPLSANKKENADTLMIATVYWKRKGESRTFPMVRRTRIMQKKPIKLKRWVSGTLSATVLLSCVNTAVFAVEASPAAVQKPELMVTELVPDTENFTGTDGKASDAYEFIELYKEGPCFAV